MRATLRHPTGVPTAAQRILKIDTILIRVTGSDGPGITTDLLALVSEAGAEVQDMEQVVVRRQLTLGLAITAPAGRDLVREVLLFGYERCPEINFDVAAERRIDIAVQPHGISRRSTRMVVPDVDSTLVRNEVIDLLAFEAGHGARSAALTAAAMAGEIDFESALRERVGLLAAAGLGIAFNAKPVVADAADTTLNVPYLDAILFMLGVTREEVEAADAQTARTA